MTKLNDTQRVILASAAARESLHVLPLPTLRAPMVSVRRTIATLVREGLLAEVRATSDDEVWRESDDGDRITLIITESGLAEMGMGPAARGPATGRPRRRTGQGAGKGKGGCPASRPTSGRRGAKHRPETKQAVVVRMLRNGGASIAELAKATGWQEHSVRGVLTATVKKRLNLPLVSEKGTDGVRRYHIAVLRTDQGRP